MSAFMKRVANSDVSILGFFNKSMKCRLLDWFMPKVTYLGSVPITSALCLFTLFYPRPYIHRLGVKLTTSLVISTTAAWIIKISFSRIRPYLKIDNLNLKKISVDKYSFPSGHSTAVFSLGVMASFFFPLLTIFFILLACSAAISRMYIGVHYPSDVFVGIFIGTFTSFLVYYLV